MNFQLHKIKRRNVYIKMILQGCAGSGKSYSSLLLAKGLGCKKIAVIDTENGSINLYDDLVKDVEVDVLEMLPPFDSDKLMAAIKYIESQRYDCLIIDSLSHFWAGEGGLFEQKINKDMEKGKGFEFANWVPINKKENQYKSAIINSQMHIIGTIRMKQEYGMETNDKGKLEVRKMGQGIVQRDSIDYEFSLVFNVDMNHKAVATKDRTRLFEGDPASKISEQTGQKLITWLQEASPTLSPEESLALAKKIDVCDSLEKLTELSKEIAEKTAFMTPMEKEPLKNHYLQQRESILNKNKSNVVNIDKMA